MARSATARKLEKYRSMRDFSRTPEPRGSTSRRSTGNSFVIQKHAARRLHYDFRLEHEGVLLSWAVPKGPSLSPTERRLAVRTEDHPLDYGDFEGTIAEGEYGAGSVAVWDRGTWEPEEDPHAMLAKGRLTFTLHGEKLHGRWHLVRTKPQGKQESWLLFKGRDAEADEEIDIVEEQPNSVLSGRTIEQIGKKSSRVWHGKHRSATPTVAEKRTAKILERATARDVHAMVAKLPLGYELTNLDKVLYPEQGITKGELIAYLAVVAEWMLPHVARRPLTLVRCPDGHHKHCFFQKALLAGSPPPVLPLPLEESDGKDVTYMQIDDLPGLVALAQLGSLEIHTWGSHTDKIERPDLIVFDLDPDVGLGWERVALAAFELRGRLNDLGLESWVKTTGGKGLHVVVPIERRLDWDEVKDFSRIVVEHMEHDDPARYTTNMAKRARKGRVFLDYLRNGRGATFIAPYSPRARPHAPVAVPISWEELAHGIDPLTLTTTTVPKRLGALDEDPWHDLLTTKQAITAAMRRKAA
ncbi:MAG: non-homologous end-joining DNA ligase [Kofleriaceae bacterium]|nr:non-homologous end-joining DNA ligase [Kofleriaceae bacterium]